MIRKPCSKCGTIDIQKYERVRNGKLYRSSFCILCAREKYSERYYKIKQDANKYNKLLSENVKRAKKNKEATRNYQRRWEIINAQDIRRRKQDYYIANKEKILARNKLWKAKNRIKVSDKSEHPWVELNRKIRKISEKI